jgi:hypothetical protein
MCSRSDFCDIADCGGLYIDENGCRRIDCQSDVDCAVDERCTSLVIGPYTGLLNNFCGYASPDGTCWCPPTSPPPQVVTWCDPETIAGPRGDFQQLDIVEATGPCPPGETCSSSWTITPDGHVDFSKNGVIGSANLSTADRDLVLQEVDSPELRVGLRDGPTCDPPPTDVGVTFRLQLSTETLERDVTGCAISGPSGNVFELLFDLAQRY